MSFKNKIVLGTMKLKKNFSNFNSLSNFLNYAHKKGIKKLHISFEYTSYNLLIKYLNKNCKKKFTLIVKLPEPENDQYKFNIKKFKKKINKYLKDCGKKHDIIVQFVNRYQCKNSSKYLLHEKKIFDEIENTVINLKRKKQIKGFYHFPYHTSLNGMKKYKFLNGITYYRNIYNTHIDHYAKQNNFKIVAIRTFGGDKIIIKKNNLKKLIMFNLKSKLVKNIIVGMNNKVQLDELLQVC